NRFGLCRWRHYTTKEILVKSLFAGPPSFIHGGAELARAWVFNQRFLNCKKTIAFLVWFGYNK
ncbi:MAG: hypothetical protein IJU50_03080, partial [Lachnospiraceae bacterium]|nr:hypothetical protein [Lachnospiraceae bacterium]